MWGHSCSTKIVLASIKVPAKFGLDYMQLGNSASSATYLQLGSSASLVAVSARQQCQSYPAWQQCQLGHLYAAR